jgi:hypothetical protein
VSPAEVRALVKEALAPHLGRYVTASNVQLPALSVSLGAPEGYRMDPTFRRHLEAVILPSPALSLTPKYGGNIVSRTWVVKIKDWGPVIAPTAEYAGVAIAAEELAARLDVVNVTIQEAEGERIAEATCYVRDFGTSY